MPVTLNGYEYSLLDGDFTIPNLVGKPRQIFPFDADTSVYNYEEDYIVLIDYYEPLQSTTRHDDFPNVYYIKDSPISDIGNGLGKFTRTWALLPGFGNSGKRTSYVNSTFESYVFSVPGITATDQGLINQYTAASSLTTGGFTIVTATAAHDIAVGKAVLINYHVADPLNRFTYHRSVVRKALTGTTGAVLKVSAITDINSVVVDSFKRSDVGQDSYQKSVTSRIDTDYWLPGVNVTTVNDIPIIDEFRIISGLGSRTDSLSETSSPSLDTYIDWVEDKRWIVAEPSIIRIYQGDMYSRSTRYIRACF
jgi:hypothetical protein